MRESSPGPRTRLRDLRNLGPASEAALTAVGITAPEQLEDLGPAGAYRKLLQHGHPQHRTMLWALAGAVLDLDWRDVPADLKQQLLAEIEKDSPPIEHE